MKECGGPVKQVKESVFIGQCGEHCILTGSCTMPTKPGDVNESHHRTYIQDFHCLQQ